MRTHTRPIRFQNPDWSWRSSQSSAHECSLRTSIWVVANSNEQPVCGTPRRESSRVGSCCLIPFWIIWCAHYVSSMWIHHRNGRRCWRSNRHALLDRGQQLHATSRRCDEQPGRDLHSWSATSSLESNTSPRYSLDLKNSNRWVACTSKPCFTMHLFFTLVPFLKVVLACSTHFKLQHSLIMHKRYTSISANRSAASCTRSEGHCTLYTLHYPTANLRVTLN